MARIPRELNVHPHSWKRVSKEREKINTYALVDLVHGRVRIVACDLDDAAALCHADQTRPVGRPCDIKHLDVMVRSKQNKRPRTEWSQFTVYTRSCVAMLVMQSEWSELPVATNIPSGEIAHPNT